jgi:hypothetical protein
VSPKRPIYGGSDFIYGGTQKLSVSQNRFMEAVIIFIEAIKKSASENGFTEADI